MGPVNRREALLGATLAGALAALPMAAAMSRPAPSVTAWNSAVARWEAAKKHMEAVNARHDIAFARFERRKAFTADLAKLRAATNIDALGAASDKAGEAVCDAWVALITTPAPHAEAFLFKLEELIGEAGRSDNYGDSWSAELLDAALADARRLLSAGRA